MPLQQTSGNVTQDAYGGGVAAVPVYVEDVMSTFLYTGNGSTQTITNGIDLAGKGGLTWIKRRDAVANHALFDTGRGATKKLYSDLTNAEYTDAYSLTSFNADGFSVGLDGSVNNGSGTYASWTFRKQPKFFDVVTYTGNGTSQNIAHNLGSVPGCIIVKSTSTVNDWRVYHRSLATVDSALRLNSTAAVGSSSTFWNSTAPTSTQFTVGSDGSVNANGATYVAYLFAHNAGGFGLTGTDNVISCGSFTTDGSGNATVNLGYEPQWLLVKNSQTAGTNWQLCDNMRGWTASNSVSTLNANTSGAEVANNGWVLSGTGFSSVANDASKTYIYIAIRRGPMKTPTSGTSVYQPIYDTSNLGNKVNGTVGPIDLTMQGQPTGAFPSYWMTTFDRLRGSNYLLTAGTAAEAAGSVTFDTNVGVRNGTWFTTGGIVYNFKRAPGFFDEVCYTISGSSPINHNLGVAPELVIYKTRGSVDSWYVCANTNGFGSLNSSGAWGGLGNGNGLTNIAQVTSTTISNSNGFFYTSGQTIVAYLFASCPGVSKVTNFTGNGSTQTINCGFTTGARFVLIKATSTTGNWLVFDTARGMTTSTDPWLALNSTAAESATTGACTTTSVGFTVDESKLTGVNTNGVSYIALAVA